MKEKPEPSSIGVLAAAPAAGWRLETSAASVPEFSSCVDLGCASWTKHARNDAWLPASQAGRTREESCASGFACLCAIWVDPDRREWITWRFPLRSCALCLRDRRFYLRRHRKDASPGWEGKPVMARRSECETNFVPIHLVFVVVLLREHRFFFFIVCNLKIKNCSFVQYTQNYK